MRTADDNDDDQQAPSHAHDDNDDDEATAGRAFLEDDRASDESEADATDAVNLEAAREQLSRARNDAWLSAPAPGASRIRRIRRRAPGPRPPASDIEVAPGRIAIAQGQVYIIGALLIIQLFLITTSLYELLSGRTQMLWPIAGGALVIFLIALVVALWPRRARDGF